MPNRTTQSSKECYVYVFRNPLKKYEPFYVGKGKGSRWRKHLTEKRIRNPYKNNTIKKIQAADMEPVIELMWRGGDEKYALGLEVELIRMYGRKCDGGTLTNLTRGGEGTSGFTVSEDTRHKISVAVTGRKHTAESLLNMSKAQKGRVVSEEHRLNMSKSRKGYVHLEETKLKISKALKGRVVSEEERLKHMGHVVSKETGHKISLAKMGHSVSEESRRKTALANTGRKHSEETKLKMSLSGRLEQQRRIANGYIASEETRRKIGLAGTGRKHSEDTRAKMRAAQLLRRLKQAA
jgi:hypothetical protein